MKKEFLGGVLGGFLIVGIFIIVIFSTNIFNYGFRVVRENTKIVNPVSKDSLVHLTEKEKIILDLEKDGLLLTPQEYTSGVVNYYNTVLTILASMLILFSIVSYLQLRFLSEKQITEVFKNSIKDSNEFREFVTNNVFGRAEDKFVTVEDMDAIKAYIEKYPEPEILQEILSKIYNSNKDTSSKNAGVFDEEIVTTSKEETNEEVETNSKEETE